MMSTKGIWILLLIAFGLCSACEKEWAGKQADPQLFGTWVRPEYNGDTVILDRAGQFDENDYGICFQENGELVERKNSGWCGTPPISYDNFHGVWTLENDTLIHVRVDYWGGTTRFNLRIVEIDESNLYVMYRYTGI